MCEYPKWYKLNGTVRSAVTRNIFVVRDTKCKQLRQERYIPPLRGFVFFLMECYKYFAPNGASPLDRQPRNGTDYCENLDVPTRHCHLRW
jgi:hypothetical protein